MTLHNTNNLGWLKFTLCRLTKHKKNFTTLSEVHKTGVIFRDFIPD